MEFRGFNQGLDFGSSVFPNYSFMSSSSNGSGSYPALNKSLTPGKSEKRKSVSFNDQSKHIRIYHQDEVVNKVHIQPKDPLDPHTFLSFWRLPGLRKSKSSASGSSDLLNFGKTDGIRYCLNEIYLSDDKQTLIGVLSVKADNETEQPAEIPISYTLNNWTSILKISAKKREESKQEYYFQLNLKPMDPFMDEIERQINDIMSKNQDLFGKSSVSWEGCCRFRLDQGPLEWTFACHVSKVKGAVPEKQLLNLADEGFKLNDGVDISPETSPEPSRQGSVDNLAVSVEELLALNNQDVPDLVIQTEIAPELIQIDTPLANTPVPAEEPKPEKKEEKKDASFGNPYTSYSTSIYMSMYSY